MEISKSDWKLFRACIAEWQENYMERLVKEYIDMLNGNGTAYNYGSWSRINSNYATIILEAGQSESWVKFTLAPDEHIYKIVV